MTEPIPAICRYCLFAGVRTDAGLVCEWWMKVVQLGAHCDRWRAIPREQMAARETSPPSVRTRSNQ